VAKRVYATLADYEDFTDGAHEPESEDQINAKLWRASLVVDGLTRRTVYTVDENGKPVDEAVAEAFKNATCAQAAYWDTTDDPTGGEAAAGPVKFGSVSLGGSGATGNAQSKTDAAAARVAPEAVDILRTAGLLSTAVAHT